MKDYRSWLVLLAAVELLSSCAKPNHITRIATPIDGLIYTVERFNGTGPASSDFTRVYVNLSRDNATDRQLVVDGEYLTISKAVWSSPNRVLLCVSDGITSSYRNEVTLHAGSASETIRTILRERC